MSDTSNIPTSKPFDSTIIEEYEKGIHNCSGWWDEDNHKPYDCMIEGDTSTRVNIGWFTEKDGQYYLTDHGRLNYGIWLKNNDLIDSQVNLIEEMKPIVQEHSDTMMKIDSAIANSNKPALSAVSATDLHIGNWTIVRGIPSQITSIGKSTATISTGFFVPIGFDHIFPILLTDIILFNIDGDYKVENGEIIIRTQDVIPDGRRVTRFLIFSIQNLMFVHRFQNLYHALRGEELKIESL